MLPGLAFRFSTCVLVQAPEEVEYLVAEVSEAKTTLGSLQTTVFTLANSAATVELEQLQSLLSQYAALLDSVETLIDKHFVKEVIVNGDETESVVRRWGWAIRKSKVTALRDKVRDQRLLILAELGAINS
jgi:hypothetical protein